MRNSKEVTKPLTDFNINIKIKLACLWATLMFLYIYADYFQLMTPGKLENLINLQTPVGPTTPLILVIFSSILIVPALMISLSAFLKPNFNKWLNVIVASLYTAISILIIISSIGTEWYSFYVLFNLIETAIFIVIIVQALRWPTE